MDAQGGAEVLELLKELDESCDVRIPHSVVLTRVNAAVTTRALQAAKDFLAARGISTLSAAIAERAAYRDVFDKGGMLQAMNPDDVSNLPKALENAARLADAVIAMMPQKAARPAAARKVPVARAA